MHPDYLSPRKLTAAEALQSARETKALEIGHGILGQTPDLFARQFPRRAAMVVADTNTFRVAGQAVYEAFRRSKVPCYEAFVFEDKDLHAEMKFEEQLEAGLKQRDAIPVAVGSGTLNDLTKLAAHRLNRPYMVVATAASMDGYTAFGASITHQGSKQTFTCPAPADCLADLDVLCAAPPEMNASGYADLLAKNTAGADWLLADALGAEPIDLQAWNIVQGGLRDALSHPEGIRTGDPKAVGPLIEGLMLGGFAMQAARSSRPASGADHQFSHLWDMQHHTHNGVAPSHGFKVGIGTLAVARMYEFLFTQPIGSLDVEACCRQWPSLDAIEATIRRLFDIPEMADKAFEESKAKWIPPEQLRAHLQRLKEVWPELLPALRRHLIPSGELRQRLAAAGAPTEPGQIGITRDRLRRSYEMAYYIRRRYTVLDIAARASLLDSALNTLFPAEPSRA